MISYSYFLIFLIQCFIFHLQTDPNRGGKSAVYFAVPSLPVLFLCTTGANLFLASPESTERPPSQTFMFVQRRAASRVGAVPPSRKCRRFDDATNGSLRRLHRA